MRMIAAKSCFIFPLTLLAFAIRSSATTTCQDVGNYANRSLKSIPLHEEFCDPPLLLDLTGNSIKSIPSSAFESYFDLYKLDISHNQLRNVEDGAFRGTGALSFIDLSHNNIRYLNKPFENASSVKEVKLNYNELQYIDSNTFSGAASITFIDLSFNQISYVNDTAFSRLPMLETLYLAHNNIDNLSEPLLAQNRYLEVIDLSYNHLCYLSPRIFFNLSALFKVKLSHNPLHSVQFVFTYPSRSFHLDADNCGQPQIPDVKFDSSEIAINLTFKMNCRPNCYSLKVDALLTDLDCMGDVPHNVTNVTCFNNEITTSSNIAYLGSTQSTETVLPIENRQSTEDVQSMQRMQSTDDMQIIGDKQSMENQNDKSRENGFHKPITLSVLLITLTVIFIIFIIIITIIIIIFRRCWPKNC